jgi:hypothetical protein
MRAEERGPTHVAVRGPFVNLSLDRWEPAEIL